MSSRRPDVTVADGPAKDSRPDRREEVADGELVGVEDLGPRVPAGDLDLLLGLDLDLFLPEEEAGAGAGAGAVALCCCCRDARSAAASAAALSSSVVGTRPACMVSCQNCPRAVLCPDPFRRPSCLCLFLVLDICTASWKSFSLVS